MKKGFLLIIVVIFIIAIGVFSFFQITTKNNKEKVGNNETNKMSPEISGTKILEGKRIAQIIAFKNFRDEEYFIPHNIFLARGAVVKTYSNSVGMAIGAEGGEAKVDGLIDNLDVSEFDAIVFSGGPGCLKYLDNDKSYTILQEAFKEGKIIGAICISPVVLARSGILKGKKATVWHSIMDKKPVRILQENGAEFIDEKVVKDGNIITANGPLAAKDFAEEIVEALTKK